MTQEYNGHPSKGHYNVALWLNNDESLYRLCQLYLTRFGRREAARRIAKLWKGARTPDGFLFTYSRVYHALDNE